MPKTILVIDDEADYRELLSHVLKQSGYEVQVATNGAEGLERLAGGPAPDMVLLDLNLPDTDGYEMCRKIRELAKTKTVPIIMVTIQSEMKDIVKGLRLGADDYVIKPFDPDEVVARMSALFRQAQPAG